MDSTLLAKVGQYMEKARPSGRDAEDIAEDLLGAAPELEDDYDFDDIVEAVKVTLARQPAPVKRPLPGRAGAVPGRGGPGGGRNQGSPRPHPEDAQGNKAATPSAPFRFVGLAKEVAQAGTTSAINHPLRGGVSATIDVEWAVESPLLIGEEKHGVVQPMTLSGGDQDTTYIIPGATLRGLTRAAVEIVAHGRLGFVNAHHRYGVRDFEHRYYGAESGISNVDNIRAGWLECSGDVEDPENSQWTIRPVAAWSHVHIDTLRPLIRFRGDRFDWIGKSLEAKYAAAAMTADRDQYDFTRTITLAPPHAHPVDVRGNTYYRNVCDAGKGLEGVLVFSDKVPFVSRPRSDAEDKMKKYEYVFHGAVGEPHVLHPEDVEAFQRLNSTPSDNKPTPTGSYKKLLPTLRAGHRVPIFYVGDLPTTTDTGQPLPANRGFFFGFTRLFKIPHKQSVGDVLRESRPKHLPPAGQEHQADFVENLFGYVLEPKDLGYSPEERAKVEAVARRGRIAFSMAKIAPNQNPKKTDTITTVMMTPRASFAPFYLGAEGHGGELDYSADPKTVTLAGRKRYQPRFTKGGRDTVTLVSAKARQQRDRLERHNNDVTSTLRFLTPPAARDDLLFTSTIRLTNVTPAELGAVLFALTHGGDPAKPYRHMIGRGKPFGAGQTRINRARLTVTPNDTDAEPLVRAPEGEELVSEDGLRGFCPEPEENRPSHAHAPFLEAFVTHMRQALAQSKFPEVDSIQEFLGSADPRQAEAIGEDRLEYMVLRDFKNVKDPYKSHKDGNKKPPAVIRPSNGTAKANTAPKRLLPAPLPKSL